MTQEGTIQQTNEDESIKNQMEKMVSSYDDYMKKVTLGREETLRKTTVELAGIKAGDSVLEIGCGTGTLTLAAKKQAGPSGKVCGIDIIPGMIEASQRKAAAAGEEITFQAGSIDQIPFPDNSFDEVLCSFMIFHMSAETRSKGIVEIQRVLKAGGKLLILDLALPPQPLQRAIAKMAFKGMLEHELQELLPVLEQARFADITAGPARFRILGLSVVGFVRGSAQKV